MKVSGYCALDFRLHLFGGQGQCWLLRNFSDVLVIAIISPKAKIVQIKTSPSWISPTKFWTPLFIFSLYQPQLLKSSKTYFANRQEKIMRKSVSLTFPLETKKQDWKCIFWVFVRLKSYLFSAEFKSQHQFSALSQVVTLLPKTKSKNYPKFDTCRTVSLKHIAVKKCCMPSLKNFLNFSSEESSQKQSKCHLKCISTNKGSLGGKLITWWHDPVITD